MSTPSRNTETDQAFRGFAVLDLETTGVRSSDRILEIGIVMLDTQAQPERYWRSLVQPNRGFDNSHIHHIEPRDLVNAPSFEQLAGHLAEVLQGRIVVAHNASFERRFLSDEFARVGVQLPGTAWTLDTCVLSRRLLPGAPGKLSACLEVIGVNNLAAHTALADAAATTELFVELLRRHPELGAAAAPLVFTAAQLDALPESSAPCIARADGLFGSEPCGPISEWAAASADAAFAAESAWLRRLTTAMPSTGDAQSDRYCATLAQAMVDGRLTTEELDQLGRVAQSYGLEAEDISELHEHYLKQLVIEAWADGVVTERERLWLGHIAEQLCIDHARFRQLLAQPGEQEVQDGQAPVAAEVCALAPGDRVTFTGAMVTPREAWEARAREAGLSVGGVIASSRLVVAADVHTMSGKAKKARALGVEIIDEVSFARALAAMTASINATEKDPEDHGHAELIAAVFPWLETENAAAAPDTMAVVEAWLGRGSTTALGQLSPYLRPGLVPESPLWTKVRRRLGIPSEAGITELTVEELADLPGIGRVRLQKLLNEVVLLALDEYETGGSEDAVGGDTAPAGADGLVEQLLYEDPAHGDASVLLDWLALTGAADSALGDKETIPESVAAAAAALDRRTETVAWAACVEIAEVVAADARFAPILDERLAGPASLQTLGDRFGVSRERVRQLESMLCAGLGAIGPVCELVQAAVRERVGIARPVKEIYRLLPALRSTPAGVETDLLTLLPMVGASGSWGLEFIDGSDSAAEETGRWLVRAGFAAAVDKAITAAADNYGVLTLEELASAVGADTALMREWIDTHTPYALYKDHVLSDTGSVVARASAVLRIEGEPMSTEQLHAVLSDRSSRSIDGSLSSAEHVQRCGARTWALREWGKEEWTTISDFIGARLAQANAADPERRTSVPLRELIAEATGYGVAENSVRAFAATGDFVVEHGQVRYRTEEEALVNHALPEETKGLYLRDGEWNLLLRVSHDHVRGSGTGISLGVLAIYDVPFGETRMIPSRLGEQRLTWGKTTVSLGTISRFIQDLGLEEGERMWLRFGESFDIARAPAERDDAEGLVLLINRIGLDEEFLDADGVLVDWACPEVVIAALNLAMGLPAECARRKTVRRLRDRGDDELAELVRTF
ncbi:MULTISPECIES: exonuclease domain-containing protein [unclassified Corynebacterium]|uniref:exonuclease domain-containing protein n=1 Tax=unclassified Corynebacterium TaxID=2624378 RepID=UPI00124F3233|nr:MULTISPECIES: exonuclease domain-containing protein [unclassified Corynebacterium]